MPRGVGEEDADLGVLDPPGGAGVLPRHAGRLGALLEEPGLVEDQDRLGVAEALDDVTPEVVADRVGVPFGPAYEVLDAVGVGVADRLGELPGVLALDGAEQADEVGPDAVAGLAAGNLAPILRATSSSCWPQSWTSSVRTAEPVLAMLTLRGDSTARLASGLPSYNCNTRQR